MKLRLLLYFTAASLFISLICPYTRVFAKSTGVRTSFTRTPTIGAHNVGMGTAVEAVTDDVFSIYWNPAGLSQLRRKKLTVEEDVRLKLKRGEIDQIREKDLLLFSENKTKFFMQYGVSAALLDESRETGFAGFAFNIYDAVLGFGALGANSSGIQKYDVNGSKQGTTDYRSGVFYSSISYPTEFVSFGVTSKVLYESLDSTHYTGLGSDIGIQTDFIPLVQLGVVVQDLGTGLKPYREQDEFSNEYVLTDPLLRMNLAISSRTADFVLSLGMARKFENEDPAYKLGFQYNFASQSSFLIGVRSSLFSTGLKMNLWSLDVSYALAVDSIDYGYNHTASVMFLF